MTRRTIVELVAIVVIGLLSVFCVSEAGRGIAIVAGISVIGLPLMMFMGLLPTMFVILVLARLVYMVFWPFGIRVHWVVCAVVRLGLLTVIPVFENQRLSALAEDYVAGDRTDVQGNLPVGTLAVISLENSRRPSLCDDLCQRALLSGNVQKVILGRVSEMPSGMDKQLEGMGYWLERRQTCPDFQLKTGIGTLNIGGKTGMTGAPTPADLLYLKASTGMCFIQQPMRFSNADTLIFKGMVVEAPSARSTGLRWDVDTISAGRISVYVRDGEHYSKRYQKTGVKVGLLWPVLMTTYVGGYGLEIYSGLARRNEYLGGATRNKTTPAIEPVLVDFLKLNLSLDGNDTALNTRREIRSALRADSPLGDKDQDMVRSYFQQFGQHNKMNKDDALLAIRLLNDDRVKALDFAAKAVRMHGSDDRDLAREFADVLFARAKLVDLDEHQPRAIDGPAQQLRSLSRAIAELPDQTVIAYRKDLELFARDQQRRVVMRDALKRLSVLGETSVPTFLYLIDEAHRERTEEAGRTQWQMFFITGMEGLCRTGANTPDVVRQVYDRLDSGVIVTFGNYWHLTLRTLAALGADADEMWSRLNAGSQNHTRKQFDRMVKSARSGSQC